MNLLIVATNSGTIASRNLVQINATNIKAMLKKSLLPV
jgi:hypothetical protein